MMRYDQRVIAGRVVGADTSLHPGSPFNDLMLRGRQGRELFIPVPFAATRDIETCTFGKTRDIEK